MVLEYYDGIGWVSAEGRWAERVLERWNCSQSWRTWRQHRAALSMMIHVGSRQPKSPSKYEWFEVRQHSAAAP